MSSLNAVLYVDHRGHPAPLMECFHATASRRLSSTVYRYPVATSQEVDSAYCPQCLTFHDASTAAELGYCSKPACRRCPLCLSVASVHTSNEAASGGIECFFQCGFCDWTSKVCDLTVTVPSDGDGGKLDRLELMRAAEDMNSMLMERRKQAIQRLDEMHRSLTDHWSKYRAQQHRHETKRQAEELWSLELLEANVQAKAAAMRTGRVDCPLPTSPNMPVQRRSIQEIMAQQSSAQVASAETKFADTVSLLSYHLQSMDAAPLLPLSIPLMLRQSRRCREELADGRPGILLKPKLNPLEGDSSLPTGHGQWFRKVRFHFNALNMEC
jgi:dynactin 4